MAAPNQYPGLGERLRDLLRETGYWNTKRNPPTPDILRFCREKGYTPQYIYDYLKDDRMPSYDNVVKLAKDLEAPAAWILLGDDGVREAAAWWTERGGGTGKGRPRKR